MSRIIIANYDTQTRQAFDSGNTEGIELVFGPQGCVCAPGLDIENQLRFVRRENRKGGIDALVFSNHGAIGLKFAQKIPKILKPKSLLVFQSCDLMDYYNEHREELFGGKTFSEAYAELGITHVTFYETMVDYVKKFVEAKK